MTGRWGIREVGMVVGRGMSEEADAGYDGRYGKWEMYIVR